MDNKLIENIDPNKQKYINLFKYLKEFALLRDEVVRNIEQSSKYQFQVWLNDIPENKSFECIIWDSIQDKETANWIQIKKPKEPEFPMPSEELRQWIVIASDITDTINIPSLNENIIIEDKIFELKDFPNIQKEFNSYLEKWLEWAEIYKEYLNLMTIYNKFFNIYKQSKKFGDEYELVMGIGLLCFKVEGEAKSVIKRHCFVADASIDFNAEKGIFTINEGKEGAKLRLETEMLKDLLEYDMNIQTDVEDKLKEYSEVPFSNDLKNTLKMWVQSLHFNGNFIDQLDNKISLSSKPTILYAPAIILRKRNTKSLANSFSNIIDYILKNMPDKINLIDDLIGNVDFESDYNETNNNSSHKNARDEEIYFPKPANEQQIEIVERLKRHNKVLVQGPPGTGKSHTIANLICHLLATNKKVLITAQTKRALSVIKEKLPEEIQPLCINLLGNDQDSIEDLESSVKEINNRLSYFDKKKTIQDIKVFETKLKEKKTLLSETKNKIIAIREKDTKKHHINDEYNGTLLEISYKIKQNDQFNSWFQDSINKIENLDNLSSKYEELLSYKKGIKNYNEEILEKILPDKNKLISIEELKEYINNKDFLNNKLDNGTRIALNQKYTNLNKLNINQKLEVKNILSDIISEITKLKKFKLSWSINAINECLNGYFSTWKQLYDLTSQSLNENLKSLISNFEYDVKISLNDDVPKQKIKQDALEILNHLNNGGKLKAFILFTPKVIKERFYITEKIYINGNKCDNTQTLEILINFLDIESEFDKLKKIWQNKINGDASGSYVMQFAEYDKHKIELSSILSITQKILDLKYTLENKLKVIIEDNNQITFEKLLTDIDLLCIDDHIKENDRIKFKTVTYLKELINNCNCHDITNKLLEGLEKDNIEIWQNSIHILISLIEQHEIYLNFKKLKNELILLAPIFTNSLINDQFADFKEKISKIKETFEWSYSKNFLNELLGENSESILQSRLDLTTKEISEIISNLASLKAWNNLFENMTSIQRQNLVAWYTTVKKIGKGTGKNAARLRKTAQSYMNECRSAIPGWIMPLYKVVENFKPEPQIIDYVIIDEASQCGPDAIFLMFLAKNIIIVGDDKQTSPEYVGVNTTIVNSLVETHLKDIPFKDYFGTQFSFFDHAYRFCNSGNNGMIVLQEHFRCMPEIIEFSNKNFYALNRTPLFPLRQYSEKRLKPLKPVYINDGYVDGESPNIVNVPEAEAIAEAVAACVHDPEYDGKTFGVISLLGKNQAEYIENLLMNKIGAEEIEDRNIICGDSASFQGDERDVIFLSLVIASNKRFNPLTKENDKRRFNVAASRAKDQMWLFHSVKLDDLNNDECMRYKLLSHFYELSKVQPLPEPKFESDFEKDVYNKIISKGYHVITQYKVGNFRIDMIIVLKNGMKLAIECDGDKFHGPEQHEHDILRQRTLERCGWTFFRIRGCEYYSNAEKAMNPLWKFIETSEKYRFEEEPKIDTTIQAKIIEQKPESKLEVKEVSTNYLKESNIVSNPIVYSITNIEESANKIIEGKLKIANFSEDSDFYETIINIFEFIIIAAALHKFNNNQVKATTFLGFNRNTLRSKIEKLNLKDDANYNQIILDNSHITDEIIQLKTHIYNLINNILSENNNFDNAKFYYTILNSIEKQIISKILILFNGNQVKTSAFLGINRNTLRSKIEKLNLTNLSQEDDNGNDNLTLSDIQTEVIPDETIVPKENIPQINGNDHHEKEIQSGFSNWFKTINPEIWFKISHYGKQFNVLNAWERKFLFEIGKISQRRSVPTEKQLKIVYKIYNDALNGGFNKDHSYQIELFPSNN